MTPKPEIGDLVLPRTDVGFRRSGHQRGRVDGGHRRARAQESSLVTLTVGVGLGLLGPMGVRALY
jgi:hypothetical protein